MYYYYVTKQYNASHLDLEHLAYGANPASNNSAEFFARILALELLPPHLPTFITYDSQIVYDLHHNLISISHTPRHLGRHIYSSISKILAYRLRYITIKHGI